MGERGKLHGPSVLMVAWARARSRVLSLTVVVMLAWPAIVSGAVTVSASLTEALYSATTNMDCAMLHALDDQEHQGKRRGMPAALTAHPEAGRVIALHNGKKTPRQP